MDIVIGLISLLFNVASSQDAPILQPQYVQYLHDGLAFVLLCVPVLFADHIWYWCGFPVAVLVS